MHTPHLDELRRQLLVVSHADHEPFWVPGAWVDADGEVAFPSGATFFVDRIDSIERGRPRPSRELIFNAMIRHVTAFQHYKASASLSENNAWKSTGTFLKFISIVPYLQSMGVTQVVLLPMFARGVVGRKGALGSPYAVKNPFLLDDDLAEPGLTMSAQEQAIAMVEALHLAGIRVVLEVVLRTASRDSDLAVRNPEWFYWINDRQEHQFTFAAPAFSAEVLQEIHKNVSGGGRSNLPEPDLEYQQLFHAPPSSVAIDQGGIRGESPDGNVLRIPGAFADWPPDDPQPAWSDVTYLRLHNHPDLNYLAYNTIRMFDQRLEHEECIQTDLWNELAFVIPHYQRTLGIDGAMIDMGHALPLALKSKILRQAREQDPAVVIYEECFELSSVLAEQGINAVMGYLPHASRDVSALRSFTKRIVDNDVPIAFFAAVDSHNTPRITSTYNEAGSFAIWRYVSLLPRALPYMVSGFELGDTYPINTGLDFTPEQIEFYAQQGLPLFDDVHLPWDSNGVTRRLLRQRMQEELHNNIFALLEDDDIMTVVRSDDSHVLAYIRQCRSDRRGIFVGLNLHQQEQAVLLQRSHVVDTAVSSHVRRSDHAISITLPPQECVVLPILVRSAEV